ncbi:lipase [Melampsora larici-populina 98AG31]|uniref:Lipase n=1 Tax=Melampsora larici-populina (strain 98AG31 / pathotype 3-4-7) TaxID=747676 RepID=F4S1J1_MELLP|nr:lipase [Melampsora larici-populina 98AG31]EGG01385.1 lipase [Melampsora larici-populina 98AG31]
MMAINSLRLSVNLTLLGFVLVNILGYSRAANNLPEDAPFTVPKQNVESSLKCIDASKPMNKPGGVILLVHGTLSAPDTWDHYVKVLPKKYNVCTIKLPDNSLSDVQVASEYVAYAIKILAQQSDTEKVKVICHSQGCLNTQWALTFWPSLRIKVESFIALAGDFAGTTAAKISCQSPKKDCPISYAQQSPNSNFLKALNSDQDSDSGASALVLTFSIYSDLDDVVESSSSQLPGAKLIPIQSFCGKSYRLTHLPIVIDSSTYQIVQDVLEFNSFLPSRVKFPCQLETLPLPDMDTLFKSPSFSRKSNLEPGLKPYVCSRGYATQCDS